MMEMCQTDTDQFPLVKSRAKGGPEDSDVLGGTREPARTEIRGRAERPRSTRRFRVKDLPTKRFLATEGKRVASPRRSRRVPPDQAAEANVTALERRPVAGRGENPARCVCPGRFSDVTRSRARPRNPSPVRLLRSGICSKQRITGWRLGSVLEVVPLSPTAWP